MASANKEQCVEKEKNKTEYKSQIDMACAGDLGELDKDTSSTEKGAEVWDDYKEERCVETTFQHLLSLEKMFLNF